MFMSRYVHHRGRIRTHDTKKHFAKQGGDPREVDRPQHKETNISAKDAHFISIILPV
jgi:hypothetical protein